MQGHAHTAEQQSHRQRGPELSQHSDKTHHNLHTDHCRGAGIALKRKLPALQEAGVNALNISLDTMQDHKFQLITRRAQAPP